MAMLVSQAHLVKPITVPVGLQPPPHWNTNSTPSLVFATRPFGDTLSSAKDDVGYTGHKFDADLQLSYMQARYYDPVIGRFYGNDPVDAYGHLQRKNLVHGFSRYTYANNNPYKYTDPDGKAAEFSYLNRPWGVSIEENRIATGDGAALALQLVATGGAAGLTGKAVSTGVKAMPTEVKKEVAGQALAMIIETIATLQGVSGADGKIGEIGDRDRMTKGASSIQVKRKDKPLPSGRGKLLILAGTFVKTQATRISKKFKEDKE